jgi:outer membrane protein assembly factor BamB
LVALTVLGGLSTISGAAAHAPSVKPLPIPPRAPLAHGIFGPPGDNWTTFMGDDEHDSYQSVSPSLQASTAANLSLQWSFQSGGVIISEPVVANDRVYFGSWDGNEYSLQATNGSKVWSTYTGQSRCVPSTPHQVGVSATATLEPADLYLGGGKDYWDDLSPSNGSVRWQVYTGNSNSTVGGGHYNWASPLIYGGDAYIGLASHCDRPLVQGQLLKVDLSSHVVVQVFNTTPLPTLGATIWSTPAVNPSTGTIFFATGNLYACCGRNTTLDDSIVAVNASTMTQVGHFQVPYSQRISDGDFGASVTLFHSDNGTAMVGDINKDGLYFALRQGNLSAGPVWVDHLSLNHSFSSASFAHGNLYIGSARTTSPSGAIIPGSVRSINATTGVVNWERTMPGPVNGPVAVANNVVIAGGGRELAVLSASTGKLLYRFNSTGVFDGGPSVAAGRIYIGNVYGTLYCLGFPLAARASDNASAGGSAPLDIAFHAAGFGGLLGYNYSWSFGDGTYSAKANPDHTYSTPGTYLVSLSVTDQYGAVATASVIVVVTDRDVRNCAPGRTFQRIVTRRGARMLATERRRPRLEA